MSPLAIIEDFNVLKHVSSRFSQVSIVLPMHSLSFQSGEETLGHCIIVAISRSTHAAFNSLIPKKFLKITAGILTTPIGVMNEARCWGPSSQGHREGI